MKNSAFKFLGMAFLAAGAAVWFSSGLSWSMGQNQKMKPPAVSDRRLEGLVRAPEFPSRLEWLNTDKPLSLKSFQGKMVLLDFWTYCCINCIHVIPDLKKLEEKYPEELVVIGVHSAKFENEKNTDSIRQAMMRYEIKHPVINDKDMEVWNLYAVHSWPTLVLINPEGRIIGEQSGEDIFEIFDGLIAEAVQYFDAKGQLKRTPLKLALEAAKREDTLLSFPGKIHADQTNKKLFISDSNHNRILMTDADGNIEDVIGNGRIGQTDGTFEKTELNHPQGVYRDGDVLYIADTENHLIRKADLKSRTVETVLGTGKKAVIPGVRGQGKYVPLSSPWDLLVEKNKLYIAMAGAHQIWQADPQTWEAEPYAGSGGEARLDGPLISAALAQPSGITTDGSKLYFADSEVSSIRSADLSPNGKVETLIGEDLFEFGDIDGPKEKARLQHALGVVYADGKLFAADTYNSKIKIYDFFSKNITGLAGTGKHGAGDGGFAESSFYEPGGLAFMDGKLYVADTNNHQIRVLDLKTQQVSTLELKGFEKLAGHAFEDFQAPSIRLPEKHLKEGKVKVMVSFNLPGGYEFSEGSPMHVDVKSGGESIVRINAPAKLEGEGRKSFPIEIPLTAKFGRNDLVLDAVIYYCKKESRICLFEQIRYELPLSVTAAGSSRVKVSVSVQPKK